MGDIHVFVWDVELVSNDLPSDVEQFLFCVVRIREDEETEFVIREPKDKRSMPRHLPIMPVVITTFIVASVPIEGAQGDVEISRHVQHSRLARVQMNHLVEHKPCPLNPLRVILGT